MNALTKLADGLRNALTGTGTGRDARSYSTYSNILPMTQMDVANAYSGSGLMRKIVTIPALDMVREWRDWKGLDEDQIAAIEMEEKRLGIRRKLREVEVLRALGGGALILGLPGELSEPAPKPAGNSLSFVHVVSRWHLSFTALETDARKEGYGEPLMWQLNTGTGQETIHPSRVIPFRSDTAAMSILPTHGTQDAFWGESVVKQVLDAVQDCDTARASFAALLHKARLLRIGIPGLYDMAASGQDETVMNRLAILASAESLHNATIFDSGDSEGKGGEVVQDATYSFAGAKDILNTYAEFVAAVSDIPATRLLGRAPEGMNSSGDSQQKDWNKKVRGRQELEMAPCLDRLDAYLVPSAIGTAPEGAWYEFNPLDTPSEKETAETFKIYMDGLDKLVASGTVPDEALARGVQSRLTADGYFPELEAALAEMPDDERYGLTVESGALEAEGGDLVSAGGGEENPARRADLEPDAGAS